MNTSVCRTTWIAACLLLPALLATVSSNAEPRSKSPSREGLYEFSFFGKDLGREDFQIKPEADGYRIDARLELRVDGQVPSEATYFLDDQRRLVRAVYKELVPGGAAAEYRIENGVLIARGLGGSAQGERRIVLEAGSVVTGPHYVTDFFVLEPLDLKVGEQRTQTAYTFGFAGWEPQRVTLKSKREENRRIRTAEGGRMSATVYRCEIETENKTFRTRSWLDENGVSVKITVDAFLGSMSVELKDPTS